ncbi:amidohydrolase [Nocardioides iriomotensis]|uniref:Amidohydrolase n=1 Tax=Nocardioides iriomotensis TaxID=715784 RepID=A0A4Q5IZR3_9ACTN|nr:amidohydrolase family protein [Nocardioides iriomotensis]RYU11574.1 amidohydrolase [Nocardioides iriomotensis]
MTTPLTPQATQRTLLRGGYVHTPGSNSTGPHPTALCVEDGHVVWTGDDDASTHFADGADRVIELDGRLVTPAFVDSHAHLAQTGFAAAGVDLTTPATLHEALDAIAAHARATTDAVVVGHGWDDTTWPEQRPFTREELDRATGGRPAYLARVDEHSAVVSTAFLDVCPDVVHADGYDVTGRVERDAHHVARDGLARLLTPSAREDAILRALRLAAAQGIGMVHELGAPHICPPEDLLVAQSLSRTGALPEVVAYWGELASDGAVQTARELGAVGLAGDLCMDGSLGSWTSALRAPYADHPHDPAHAGHLYVEAEQVTDHVLACTEAGLQAGFHVIGDRAVDAVVAGFEAAATKIGDLAVVRGRHRLEHVEMVAPEHMATLGRLGVTASQQPVFDALWGGGSDMYAQRLGAERAAGMNAFASLNRAGVALAFGSDSPVTPFGPWAAVRAAAWHRTPSERVTVRAAFNAHTRGGWRAAARDEGGVIDLGTPASIAVWDVPGDLVVQTPDARVAAWSTDPRAGVPHLPDLHPDQDLPTCVLTMVHGQVAYEREGAL